MRHLSLLVAALFFAAMTLPAEAARPVKGAAQGTATAAKGVAKGAGQAGVGVVRGTANGSERNRQRPSLHCDIR